MSEKQEQKNDNVTPLKTEAINVVQNNVRGMIERNQLHLPPNFSPENALKSAWLTMQATVDRSNQPVLKSCTRQSVVNALLDTVVQGLHPGKKQCYYIAYGEVLLCQRSYFGDMALVQRIIPGSNVYAEVIWAGDEIEYEIVRGQKKIIKHSQKLANVGDLSKVAGAYCVIEVPDQPDRVTIMTIDQIKSSWKKSKTYKGPESKTFHTEQPDQAALRTVIRRACKPIINSSDDQYLLLSIQRNEIDAADAEIEEAAMLAADTGVIDLDPPESTEGGEVPEAESRGPEKEHEAEEQPEPVAAGGNGKRAPF